MSHSLMKIRPLKRADSKHIVSMIGELAAFHGDKAHVKPNHILENAFGTNKLAHGFVVTKGEIVGFAFMHFFIDLVTGIKKTEIDLLYIDERLRRQGAGQRLMRTLASFALEHDAEELRVSAKKTNKISNGFYAKLDLDIHYKDKTHIRYTGDVAWMKRITKKQ